MGTLGLCRPQLNQTMESNSKAIEGRASTPCSLSSLNEAARRYRKEHFQRANADPTDTEAREAYHYEEGRTRAYSEGLNALAVWENAVRNLRDVQGRHHTQIAMERLFALLPENASLSHGDESATPPTR